MTPLSNTLSWANGTIYRRSSSKKQVTFCKLPKPSYKMTEEIMKNKLNLLAGLRRATNKGRN